MISKFNFFYQNDKIFKKIKNISKFSENLKILRHVSK